MEEQTIVQTSPIVSGSALLLKDGLPLSSGENRVSNPIHTRSVSTIGIDIAADKDCTVTITRLPDGQTPGAVSIVGSVKAGIPAFFVYSCLLCPAIKITVMNTSGAQMTAFAMYVRGGA